MGLAWVDAGGVLEPELAVAGWAAGVWPGSPTAAVIALVA
jgi:hypothetical protein